MNGLRDCNLAVGERKKECMKSQSDPPVQSVHLAPPIRTKFQRFLDIMTVGFATGKVLKTPDRKGDSASHDN